MPSEQSNSVTITLGVPTASVLLGVLLEEHARDNSHQLLYTRKWHRQQVIEAVQRALLDWPEKDSRS